MYPRFSFTYQEYEKGRIGVLMTPHGIINTPAFIFCGTKASIKSLTPEQVKEANTQVILANTYHLMLQPGSEVVAKLGGLHQFMQWDGPMLTDSGGFQIFSLGYGAVADEIKGRNRTAARPAGRSFRKITEEGALFRSYIDGSRHLLTPERSIEIQSELGADLVVVLDECTPFHVDKRYTERSMHLSHRWGLRSLKRFEQLNDGRQALYGIVQGGVYPDLREISCEFVSQQPFFGNAIGGSLGASKSQMYEVVQMAMQKLDRSRPTHLLGIGGIADIFAGVAEGIDTFDCVHPTRIARHGGALVSRELRDTPAREHLNLNNARYKLDNEPIDQNCGCYTCQNFSRGYLHHLLKAKEILATSLLTIHNVFFMNELMQRIREAIAQNALDKLAKRY
ncbi:MAG: tRNA guanosine(34) transglycosylase Tgt [Proteobacteria bacterium]|nr:tRNA guanosine(34) transglycosylase Tgt [Pseudomonadota bacterium]